ncbi:MAG: hypothetical protein AXW14_00205 [Alteromonas sp. Nap_26]|nr:MAG: hypothetical protein AXW14_00205 [Alteromonas sp. Nap_26]
MQIKLTFGDMSLSATLHDNPTARAFYAQLPLSLTLEDYASTEKIADLDKKLTTEGAPAGSSAKKGDLTYYAPWGNLAIFYRNFGHANGLISLGKFTDDITPLVSASNIDVRIEQVGI